MTDAGGDKVDWKALTIGDRIRFMLEHRKTTQSEVAKACGLTQSAISNWISGATRKPNAPSLVRLAAALQANPDWIIYGEGDPFATIVIGGTREKALLDVFRSLDPGRQDAIVAAAIAMSNRK